ncbi:MAG TPA: acido-empty-quinoprotein group A [Candidatus Acidoferrales bacterium]|nr:acido-empty-quinoprotein group A [Candidatus Acidoferrales bacterium]
MTRLRNVLCAALLVAVPLAIAGQGLDPASLAKQSTDSWPTYSGDYSGRRFSPLTQINDRNVKNLALAWSAHYPFGAPGAGDQADIPTIIGGESKEAVQVGGLNGTSVVGVILQVDGTLYMSAPDNAWAVDARTGRVLWHYFWRTKGATHIGNRGMGMYHNWLFFETPDDYLVSLDAKTGKERWHKPIADFDERYFSTMAPIVIGDHLLVGTGDDADAPGFLQSVDPETGDVQWKWYTEPEKMGDPGSETWPNLDAMRHGGGNAWTPGSYDPDLHLYYFGTGNPTPTYTGAARKGDNLYTSTIVAINVDTGKMAWYYQVSPHDTHDWDAGDTPVLADAPFNGKPRKLLLVATRNGYFFVLDRVTGEHLLTSALLPTVNWASVNEKGQPVQLPEKAADEGGVLISPNSIGTTNWPPPAFNPATGLFYTPAAETFSEYYLTDADPRNQLYGGVQQQIITSLGNYILAVDYKTGKTVWQHKYPPAGAGTGGPQGMLTTAGNLVFAGDAGGGNLIAYNAANGNILWHSRIGVVSNAAETYTLDGQQYVLVSTADDMLYAFKLN